MINLKYKNNKWDFWIDRGGTFTDIIAIDPHGIFHTKKIIDQYAHELDKIFNKIKVIEDSKKKIKFLDGKVRESTFARLTD